MKYAGDSVREAVAVSALFLSAIATITCLSVCIVWRIITRSKRLRPSTSECFEEQNVEIGNSSSGRASRIDLTSGFSANGFSDDDDVDDNETSTSDRRLLLTPISADFDTISDAFAAATTSTSSQQHETHSFSAVGGDARHNNAFVNKIVENKNELDAKNGLASNKNDTSVDSIEKERKNSCTEYHFLNVPYDSANDEDGRIV